VAATTTRRAAVLQVNPSMGLDLLGAAIALHLCE